MDIRIDVYASFTGQRVEHFGKGTNGCYSRSAKLFNELSTSISDGAKCKETKVNTYALIPEQSLSRRLSLKVCHQPDVKLGVFRSRVSSHTEELWYNETVFCGWIYIYIYIYIYITDTGGVCGVMVIVVRNWHSDSSSNPGRDWLHFT